MFPCVYVCVHFYNCMHTFYVCVSRCYVKLGKYECIWIYSLVSCVCVYHCMYLCVYVCIYVCMCVCMYVCVDVCMYVCMYV